jgi:transcriptional regulator with XRE-family HTH domain
LFIHTGKEAGVTALGKYLRNARMKLGLSLREAEDKSHVSNAYISMIEGGSRTDPHPNILRKLARAYGLSIQAVMEKAGYLSLEVQERSEEDEVEKYYRLAVNDPEFSFGRRSKDKIDHATKKLIADMYRKLKEREKKE